jgi:hypothetical protein
MTERRALLVVSVSGVDAIYRKTKSLLVSVHGSRGARHDAYRQGHEFGQQFAQKMTTSTIRELLRGGRELTVGASLGGARGLGVLERFCSARAGSKLASTFESFRGPASRFDGLNQCRKTVALTLALPVSREQQNRLSEGLYKLRLVLHPKSTRAKEKKEVEKVFEICDLLEQHFRGGRIDLGLVVDIRPDGRFAIAAGLHTSKAKQFEKVVGELTTLVRESSSSGRYGRKSYRGTTVNEVYLTKLTKSDREIFGDRPCVRYAFTKDMILGSFGHDRMAALELKGLFDVVAKPSRPSRTPRPFQLHVHLKLLMETAILKYSPERSPAASVSADDGTSRSSEHRPGGSGRRAEGTFRGRAGHHQGVRRSLRNGALRIFCRYSGLLDTSRRVWSHRRVVTGTAGF